MQRKGAWGYTMPPVTMVTMASLIQAKHPEFQVAVLDAAATNMSYREALEAVARNHPDLVVVNTSTPTIDDDLHFIGQLAAKHSGKGPTIAAFGIHVSVLYEELLRSQSGLNLAILGEPEWTALELAEALDTQQPLANVPGLAWLEGEELVRSPQRPFLEDLDQLPIADWSFVSLDPYRLPFDGQRFLLLNTNRGCPYHCSFCNAHVFYGRRQRRRSVAHIMDEIRQDVERFGVRNLMFWAEEFVLDKAFVLALSQAIIDSDLDISWVCNSRVDGVSPEVLEKIHEAGCWNIAYGIESGAQSILDRSNKGISLDVTRKAVTWTKQAGLKVTGHVILGLPGESRSTMEETHRFVQSLELDYVQYYCAMPYPGSSFYEQALDAGWVQSHDWHRYEHNDCVVDYPQLAGKEIRSARTRYFLAFYFQPTILWKLARENLDSVSHAWHFARTLVDFGRWILFR